MIYILVTLGLRGIYFLMTGKIAKNARIKAPKLAIRPVSLSVWLKIPKFMMVRSNMGKSIVAKVELGIL